MQVTHAERDNLLNPCTGVEHGGEQGIVATPRGRGPLNRGEHRLDFGEFEILDGSRARTFERNGQNALALLKSVRMLRRTVPEEGVNRCQPHVASGGKIVPLDLKVVQEVEHVLRTEILEIQLGH